MFINLISTISKVDNQLINDQIIASTSLSFKEGTTILLISTIYGLYLRFLYSKFAVTFSSKVSFGNSILVISLSVAALVAVVKSSLALSLGLVGALSVVRYRSAVKEPYNLSFILLAISLAISNGASQYIFSFLLSIFGTLAIFISYKSASSKQFGKENAKISNIDTVHITLKKDSSLDLLKEILSESTSFFKIISLDKEEERPLSMVIKIQLNRNIDLIEFQQKLQTKLKGSSFRFYNSPII